MTEEIATLNMMAWSLEKTPSVPYSSCLSHPISSGSRFNGRYMLTSGTIDWINACGVKISETRQWLLAGTASACVYGTGWTSEKDHRT